MYKLTNNEIILRIEDGAMIPMDADNRDYAEYLLWIKKGNTPEPVDAVSKVTPSQCTRRQGRLALLAIGKLDAVEDAIAAIEDPAQKRAAQIEYEADTWERDNLFVQTMWEQLGGTPQELDDLFINAVTL